MVTTNHTGLVYYDSDEERLLPGEDWPMLRERLERNWRRGARARMGIVGEILPTPRALLDQRAHQLVTVAANERHLRSILAGTLMDGAAGPHLNALAAQYGVSR